MPEITHPADRDFSKEELRTLTGARDFLQMEKRCIRKDGETIWIVLTITPVRSADGAVDYCIAMADDVTERRTAGERIRFQARLLDAVEQAVIATDVEGRITYWNNYAEKVYGWRADEVMGRNIVDITCPSMSADEAAAVMQKLSAAESWSGEFVVRDRSGRNFPCMVIDSPILDAGGTLTGVVGVSFDLTQRKANEEALRASEERYRSVIEGVDEIIFTVGLDARISSFNRAFETVTGWLREQWVGSILGALIHSDDQAHVEAAFARALEGAEGTPFDARILSSTGDYRTVECIAYTRRNSAGEALEVFGFGRDVTEKRRLDGERAMITSELRLLLESTDEGLYALDTNGRCTLINRAAAALLGYPAEELIGRELHEVIHATGPGEPPCDQSTCPVYRTLLHASTARVDSAVMWRSDGTSFPVEYASAPVIEEGVLSGAVVTFRDITRRKMMEVQLGRANRINRLGRIAGTMAHEFNNVLMGIQPFAAILGRAVAGNPLHEKAVAQITEGVSRGKRVSEEILRFTRHSAPILEAIDLESFVDGLESEARALLANEIEFSIERREGLGVRGDAHQLRQVFINLIVNARDALGGAPGHIRLTIDPASQSIFPFGVVPDPERFAHFVLSDDGCGMTAETQSQLFEPLFTTKRSGTGLGLAFAHQVVQEHGGSILVESTLGKGSRFHVFLPLDTAPSRPIPLQPSVVVDEVQIERVVIVEDDVAVAAGLAAFLELEGIEVNVAATGAVAVDTIARCRPDVVVLDVGLPDMNGTEVYRQLRASWPMLPVLLSTGNVEESHRLSTLADNVVILSKPYSVDSLMTSMKLLVQRAAFPQARQYDERLGGVPVRA